MSFLGAVAGWVLAFIFLSYLVPHFIVSFLKPRDLKKAYNANWGLVTGASSGEGPGMHHLNAWGMDSSTCMSSIQDAGFHCQSLLQVLASLWRQGWHRRG